MAEAAKGVGKPKVGGTFALLDQEGKTFTDGDMKGGYSLVSLPNDPYKKIRLIGFPLSRSTSASLTAQISALKSLTKWPT